MLLISCDWGTSMFRLRLLRGESMPSLVAERSDASGVSVFARGADSEYRSFLAREISALFGDARVPPHPAPVLLSGMITSSLGWKQPPYAELPFPLDGSAAVVERDRLETSYGGHDLVFVSGVKGTDEVMRGEECELVGVYAHPEAARFAGSSVAILPGTHSKALEIRSGQLTGFQTFLTGELFDVLCRHSILRHSVYGADPDAEAGPSFEEGIQRAARRGLLGSLFSVRARQLLDGVGPAASHAYLSGLVIGEELTALLNSYRAEVPLLVCGNARLARLYRRGFQALGEGTRAHVLPEEVTRLAAALGHWRLSVHLIGRTAWC